MKGFIKGLISVAIPFLGAWYAYASTENILITLAVFAVILAVVLFIFRANLLLLAGMNVFDKNREKGLKLMRSAYKTGKLKPSAQLYYAYIILRNGELDEAETVMNKATVIGKHALKEEELKACEFNRAIITWKRGDLNSAIMEMEELYSEGYKTRGLYGSLGSFYNLNKEYDKAIELSIEGMDFNPDDLVTQDNLGQAYIGKGMLDEAIAVYDKLLAKAPAFLEAYYNYATIMENRGMLTEAKEYYEKALTYEEKYLSTVTHDEICEALSRIEDFSINTDDIDNPGSAKQQPTEAETDADVITETNDTQE